MTTSHTERASRMGYGGAVPTKPKPVARASPSIYQTTKPSETGSHDVAIAAWQDRRAAKFRDDPERREEVHLEARQIKAFVAKHGWSPEETQVALSKMTEREAFPRSDEAKQTLRARTQEQIRLSQGSEAAAREMLESTRKARSAFAAECPTMARRAAANGAAEEREIIEIFSRHVPSEQ